MLTVFQQFVRVARDLVDHVLAGDQHVVVSVFSEKAVHKELVRELHHRHTGGWNPELGVLFDQLAHSIQFLVVAPPTEDKQFVDFRLMDADVASWCRQSCSQFAPDLGFLNVQNVQSVDALVLLVNSASCHQVVRRKNVYAHIVNSFRKCRHLVPVASCRVVPIFKCVFFNMIDSLPFRIDAARSVDAITVNVGAKRNARFLHRLNFLQLLVHVMVAFSAHLVLKIFAAHYVDLIVLGVDNTGCVHIRDFNQKLPLRRNKIVLINLIAVHRVVVVHRLLFKCQVACTHTGLLNHSHVLLLIKFIDFNVRLSLNFIFIWRRGSTERERFRLRVICARDN